MAAAAMLAIWSDIAPAAETDYLHWLTREHTIERLSIDGFLAVRVLRAASAAPCRFLILYDLESADVLDSNAYLARLNNPTPWSRRMMPALSNFIRGGGRLVHSEGRGTGSVVSAVRLDRSPDAALAPMLKNVIDEDRIVAARLLETDRQRTAVQTREKTMRNADETFASLVLLEGLEIGAVTEATTRLLRLAPDLASMEPPEFYRQIFSLDRPAHN